MYNLISGKTLNQVVAEHGPRVGLIQFQTRCTGRTFATALQAISNAMLTASATQEGRTQVQQDVFNCAKHTIEQLGLVGFSFVPKTGLITYYPFGVHIND